MIYFLHGTDTYRSRAKLREIISEFQKKSGGNIHDYYFDAEEKSPEELKAALGGQSLFNSKKLVIVEHPITGCKDPGKLAEIISKNSPGNLVLLWDREVKDKDREKLKIFESFCSKTQEFKKPEGKNFSIFLEQEAKKRGITLRAEDKIRLAQFAGDSWGAVQELEKISLARNAGEKNDRHETVWIPSAEASTTIFSFGDSFFSGAQEALSKLLKLLEGGQEESGLFAYLSNQAGILLNIKEQVQNKKSQITIPGVHPFVVKKGVAQVRDISFTHLKNLLKKFFEEDKKIKTGLIQPRDALIELVFFQRKNKLGSEPQPALRKFSLQV